MIGEQLVQCDISDLRHLPKETDEPVKLVGSPRQITYADSVRNRCMDRWEPDLPEKVYEALFTLDDACWWIANKDAEAGDIKWPLSWVGVEGEAVGGRPAPVKGKTLVEVFAEEDRNRPASPPRTLKAPVFSEEARSADEELEFSGPPPTRRAPACLATPPCAPPPPAPAKPVQPVKPVDLVQFELFARKAANSPELAYLTMMALIYRQTKDGTVLAKFKESRDRVAGHLAAINEIAGEL